MKKFELRDKQIIMSNPLSAHNYFAWPTVARLQDGTLAAVASGFRMEHICPFGKCVISYSRDEGKTWTAPAPVIDTLLDDRDGGILPFGESSVIVTSFNNSLAQQREWSEYWLKPGNSRRNYINGYIERAAADPDAEKYLGSTFRVSHDGGVTFGEIYRSPITCPHGPLVTVNGEILYIGRRFSDPALPPVADEICCYRLDPETGEMTYLSTLPHTEADEGGAYLDCEPHAIMLPSGRIIVHVRVQRGSDGKDGFVFYIGQSVSDDGGMTFSPLRPITDVMDFGAPAHLLRHSSGKLISSVGYRTAPYGIRVLISEDDGETWEGGVLSDDGVLPDIGYPASVELADGSIYTVWYQHPEKGQPSVIYGARWTL